MDVITYQLVVVATIWLAYRINPRFALWAAIAWSAETLVLLFYPPLILIQLAVVWGTYSVLNSNASKTQRRSEERTQQAPRTREFHASSLRYFARPSGRSLHFSAAIQGARVRYCDPCGRS